MFLNNSFPSPFFAQPAFFHHLRDTASAVLLFVFAVILIRQKLSSRHINSFILSQDHLEYITFLLYNQIYNIDIFY